SSSSADRLIPRPSMFAYGTRRTKPIWHACPQPAKPGMRPQDRGSGQQEINRPQASLFFVGRAKEVAAATTTWRPRVTRRPARAAVRTIVRNWSEIQMTKGPRATVSRKHNRGELGGKPHRLTRDFNFVSRGPLGVRCDLFNWLLNSDPKYLFVLNGL